MKLKAIISDEKILNVINDVKDDVVINPNSFEGFDKAIKNFKKRM